MRTLLLVLTGLFFLLHPMLVAAVQETTTVVLMPTGDREGDASGEAVVSISDENNNADQRTLVVRVRIDKVRGGRHATHIHEGFCPPPVGPSPDQQGNIVLDLNDTIAGPFPTVTILRTTDLHTRPGGIQSFDELLDPTRNFYINVHLLPSVAPISGPGQVCGRLEFP